LKSVHITVAQPAISHSSRVAKVSISKFASRRALWRISDGAKEIGRPESPGPEKAYRAWRTDEVAGAYGVRNLELIRK
jgi:hypothetical protein